MFTEEDGIIDFVIRTRNEEQYIAKSINSVRSFFGDKSKIIIIDNESSDYTLPIVKNKMINDKNIILTYIKEKDYSPGKALNLGIKLTSSKVVGILSSHCEIESFNINDLECFKNDKCFGLIGKQIPEGDDLGLPIWENFKRENCINPIEYNTDNLFFHNAFSFISKKLWQKFKFNEKVKSKEDRKWAKKMIDNGFYFEFNNSAQARHYFTENGATWKRN